MAEVPTPRLLVVDDEPAQLRALCDTLGQSGFEVQGCGSGAEALSLLHCASFDLLLTDLNMPVMDGIALVRAGLEIDPLLAAVMMTGGGTIGTAVQAMQTGALDYILKPFKLVTALPVLNRALDIRRLRREKAALERQLEDRILQLAQANADLEAFASSVSHDLRAPLQAIDGFSNALLQRHTGQLDEQGIDYLQRICSSASRMADLMEGLRRLAHVAREPLQMTRVTLPLLVTGVLRDFEAAGVMPHDCVTVRPLPVVWGDAVLLRQVFANLLSNAGKFSARQTHPQVEVGHERIGAEGVFYVRDNGAGFDMSEAGSLFEPFRRLHSQQAFAGVGIGLSLVRRIVQRHGGRIWAEAAPGEGASPLSWLLPPRRRGSSPSPAPGFAPLSTRW
jgi:hypothetical protein